MGTPNRLLTQDNVICVLKLVTNLVIGNNFGVKVKGFTDDSRENLVDASATFISVDNIRAFVTMGELGQCKEVQKRSYKNCARNTEMRR